MARGRFITFEGGEGAGKSTQVRRLASYLESQGLRILATREPGGAPGAEEIRKLLVEGQADRWDPLAETLLHMAARRDHVEKVLRPALVAGQWVLCDRFADSTEAYQGYGHGGDLDLIRQLRRTVVGDCEPDLTIVLDIPVARGLERAHNRDEISGRYENMDMSFHDRIREAFLGIAKSDPRRCVVIDADRPEHDIDRDIRQCVRDRLGIGAE